MGSDGVAIAATSVGTSKRVMDSVDIPSAASWWMSLLERVVMGPSAPRVSRMVLLQVQAVGVVEAVSAGFTDGRRKCLQMGHDMDIEVCPCAALMLP